MEIRIRQSGQVMFESEFRSLYPNTSLPQLTKEVLDELGADVVFEGAQAQPTRYQVAYRDGVEQIGDKWFTKYSVSDMDDEGKANVDANQAKSVRDERNKKLADCDWTQLADSTADKEAWATYRQALRDIPAQEGFPFDIQWPEMP
jgi:hypothetical protein